MGWFKRLQKEMEPLKPPNKKRLEDFIPNYEQSIQLQLDALSEVLNSFTENYDTSLDVILSRAFDTLKIALAEYTKLLERVLTFLQVIDLSYDPHKRNLSEFVALAQNKAHFYGGDAALSAQLFFKNIKSEYLSDIDEYSYMLHLKAMRQEYSYLKIFILRK